MSPFWYYKFIYILFMCICTISLKMIILRQNFLHFEIYKMIECGSQYIQKLHQIPQKCVQDCIEVHQLHMGQLSTITYYKLTWLTYPHILNHLGILWLLRDLTRFSMIWCGSIDKNHVVHANLGCKCTYIVFPSKVWIKENQIKKWLLVLLI